MKAKHPIVFVMVVLLPFLFWPVDQYDYIMCVTQPCIMPQVPMIERLIEILNPFN